MIAVNLIYLYMWPSHVYFFHFVMLTLVSVTDTWKLLVRKIPIVIQFLSSSKTSFICFSKQSWKGSQTERIVNMIHFHFPKRPLSYASASSRGKEVRKKQCQMWSHVRIFLQRKFSFTVLWKDGKSSFTHFISNHELKGVCRKDQSRVPSEVFHCKDPFNPFKAVNLIYSKL